MPVLSDYRHFNGRHPETGSVHNILAYQNVKAPHTGHPYSEALLLGVSGGAAFGYFTFDYSGYDPILALLIRNTFDPLQTLLSRLGIRQTVLQTARPDAGVKNLESVLENGRPALVWADTFSLPYNGLPEDEHNWDMQPLVVYGLDQDAAHLADRSGRALAVQPDALAKARARVKKDKFRVISLDPPDEDKLPGAVVQGIEQCLALYTEKPPQGTAENFGLAAFDKWARMLTNTRNPQGWARFFPPGPRLLSALAGNAYLPGAYGWIRQWGASPDADRSAYADFLSEAALILGKPALNEAGQRFRESGRLWGDLAEALLPADAPLLGEARRLKDRRYQLFMEMGAEAEAEIRAIHARLKEMSAAAETSFPFSPQEAAAFYSGLQERVQAIAAKEKEAVEALRSALAG